MTHHPHSRSRRGGPCDPPDDGTLEWISRRELERAAASNPGFLGWGKPRKSRKSTLESVASQASKAGIAVARYEVKPDGTWSWSPASASPPPRTTRGGSMNSARRTSNNEKAEVREGVCRSSRRPRVFLCPPPWLSGHE